MNDTSPSHWTQFWQQGHITTFGAALADNYDGVIGQFWQDQFAGLPASACILDIAAGNGAVAALASRYNPAWRVHACDLAEVKPGLEETNKVEFRSGVACESLPYEDGQFDLVVSQFGIEYADPVRSIAEVYRVLKREGRFAAICHHRDSYTLNNSRQEQAIYRQALDKNNVFAAAITYLRARDARPQACSDKLQAVNYAVNRLRESYGGNPCCDQLVGALSHALRGAGKAPLEETVARLTLMEADFRGAAARLDDLARAALDSSGIAALAGTCRKAGFIAADVGQLQHAPGRIAGHTLLAQR